MFRATLLLLAVSVLAPLAGGEESEGKIRLWVRGDDFGYSHASNIAMEKAFSEGIMQSASVLAPGPWFKETAAILREHPEWSVGVHLTITSEWNTLRWRPVSPISEVPSLVAPDGYLWGFGYGRPKPPDRLSDDSPWAEHAPDLGEVEAEFRAQIEKAKSTGVRLDYIDCHMGLACREDILPITRRLAKEYCLAISSDNMFDLGRVSITWDRRTPEEAKQVLSAELRKLPPGTWLYVAHPAADTPELRAVDANDGEQWARQRSSVLSAWTDPEIRRLINELGIELINARALFDYEACKPK